jgi:hypothetical protein
MAEAATLRPGRHKDHLKPLGTPDTARITRSCKIQQSQHPPATIDYSLRPALTPHRTLSAHQPAGTPAAAARCAVTRIGTSSAPPSCTRRWDEFQRGREANRAR